MKHDTANLLAVFITALGLLDSVYFCNARQMGQLPSQASQPCTHNGFAHKVPRFRGNVSLDNVKGR